MTESSPLFADSHLAKPRFTRAHHTKPDNSTSFRNHSSSKAFRSFLNCTVQKNESTVPSDSISYADEKNFRSLRTEAFKILNDSKDLVSIDKSSFLGVDRNTSATPVNDLMNENMENRLNVNVGERVIFKRSNNANRPQSGLFLLTAHGKTRGKTGSPTPKPNLQKKQQDFEGQRIRNASRKEKGLKDFRFIYARQATSSNTRNDHSLSLKRHLTDSKLKDTSNNMLKGFIDLEQKKLDAKLCLGDSLDLSNVSESPMNAKKPKRNMTCETEEDERTNQSNNGLYGELFKKHMKGGLGINTRHTPIGGRKLMPRPQTCKNSFLSPKNIKTILSPKAEQIVSPAHKAIDTSMLLQSNIKPTIPGLHRVTSAEAIAPKIILDGPGIATIDHKAQRADLLQRPTTASPFNQANGTPNLTQQRPKKDPLHSITNFKLEKVLGQGSYAVVKLAWDKTRAQNVAVKIYDKNMLSDPRKMKNVRREISILKQMDHPHIIKLLDSFETPRQIYVIMEFVGKASLHSFLRSLGPKKLEEPEIKRIFIQLCQSIQYCHNKNIIHRDVKLENILMDDQNNVKIIDFGFSICVSHEKKLNFFCGTPSYMAPEIVSKTMYKGAPTDVWALGVILYILLCGCFPFKGADDKELFYRIQKAKPDFPAHVSHEARCFVQKLLKANPDERLKIGEVLKDRWLNI